ncbi:MAG TPA: hypothetical protein VJQ45_02160 [Ktedonobacterales bacterium]|nr:hypothetical protein [Ktedonobacterales bacterium]
MGSQPPSDGSSIRDQARRRMSESRQGKPRNLPTLPDWPPLPDEPSQADWPTLHPAIPDESHPDDALQPTVSDDTLLRGQSQQAVPSAVGPSPAPPHATPRGPGILRRFRGASKRARLGIAAAVAVALVVLIVACSSFALRTTGSLVLGNAQATAHSGTPGTLPTVTPHPTSTPTPTHTPTPRVPTATPVPTLTLTFTCASGQLRGTGQVCVHTLPRASLSLSVRYCDGSTAKGLHGATADASGNYTWTWFVRTTCAGQATATVTANWNGQSLTASDTFTIAK